MKIKQMHGEIIDGFLIIDSYKGETKNGFPTRKVLLKCQKCGNEFERNASIDDFSHVKCKCQVKSKSSVPRKKYLYNGKEYYLFELAEMSGVDHSKISRRIKAGYSLEEATTKTFNRVCVICGKEFQTEDISTICCSSTCYHRKNKGKGAYTFGTFKCKICGNEIKTNGQIRSYCSAKCRNKAARKQRKELYKALRHSGHYDNSISLPAVFEKYDGKCNMCGKSTDIHSERTSPDYPTIDHIMPLIKGGYHEWDNIQLLCRFCNGSKHSKT